uniref:Synaptogyrin n=1 Tax=Leptobrachium leishanense TaxID=445787 RepID=A0A8C5WKF9_9ANUR
GCILATGSGSAQGASAHTFYKKEMKPEIFALIVFACILTDGYSSDVHGNGLCIFGGNMDACRYGIAIGVLAFLASLLFLILDAYFPSLSNISHRKYIVQADLGFSALWSFLWFVGFCFLTNQWSIDINPAPLTGQDNARAAIAFSFFSILSWVGDTAGDSFNQLLKDPITCSGLPAPWTPPPPPLYLARGNRPVSERVLSPALFLQVPLACLAYKRFRMGVEDFNPNYTDPSQDPAPYSSYPEAVSDSYQRPPFTNNQSPEDGYKPPQY